MHTGRQLSWFDMSQLIVC